MGISAQHAADIFAYLGDMSASGPEEIGVAMQKASASAREFGLSFEWLGAYIAAMSEKTRQAPEVIGTSVNAIMARLHAIKEKGFNEEDETKINDIAKALGTIDVALMDNEGNWRDMSDIFSDIASKWDTLSGKQKSYISTTMAGTRQQNYFIALMSDMAKGVEGGSRAYELYAGAMGAAGTATQKYAVWQESVTAAQNRLTTATQEFYSLLNAEWMKGFYENMAGIDTFKTIISSGHVDVYPSAAKTTGAFENQRSDVYLPWVLFNYNGYANDVSTTAHEMGHAMYDALTTGNQPKQYRHPTIFTQEVASTTNELIYYNYKMSHALNDDEKLYYLQNALDLFTGAFFGQVMLAEFEDNFYRIVEEGGALDGEALSDKYLELLNTYRGDSIVSFPEAKYRWADIPHFYYEYYVYQYATSISYAASIAQDILNGRENAVEDYLSFLKAGHSADPQTLLSIAGVDPLNVETYHAAMDYFKSLVDEYEHLVDARLQNS